MITAKALPERLPALGELVQVRSRRWLVEAVPERDADPRVVTLACADDDAQGQALDVFWDYELDRRILEEERWADLAAKGFDEPRQFAAFLHTLRWNCVTATDPNLFQAPFRAGIKIDAYQMEPLRKALRLPRVNLFIADDTGLGKTIEAGLIARELLLRKKAKTIVVAAPPSVLEQWKAELEERFGLVFEMLDRHYFAAVRRERGFGVNPWRTHSRFLVSHNLLIDPTYADPMREWLGPLLPGSLLILDEAHHAAPSSGGRYGIETKFTRAVRDLGGRFEHRLFLSATPHNGHSNSFSTLLELLDPYRFTRGVKVRGKTGARGRDGAPAEGGHPRGPGGGFPRRIVKPIRIDGLPDDAPELVLSRLLDEYRTAREQRFARHRAGRRQPRACSSSGCSSGCCPRSRRSPAASRCTDARSSPSASGTPRPQRAMPSVARTAGAAADSPAPARTTSCDGTDEERDRDEARAQVAETDRRRRVERIARRRDRTRRCGHANRSCSTRWSRSHRPAATSRTRSCAR